MTHRQIALPKHLAQVVATHSQEKKGGETTRYRVFRALVPKLGANVFWLEGVRRATGRANDPPGAQNYMQMAAGKEGHCFWAAFDVPTGVKQPPTTKAFASYADDRAFYDALFTSDLQQRKLPSGMLNTSYEIVREGFPCWPHFDIEWDPAVHRIEEPAKLVLLFQDLLIASFKRHFPFQCLHLERKHFRVSRSRNTAEKRSYHVVLRAGVAFLDSPTHHHAFMQTLFRELVIALTLDGDQRVRNLFFDRTAVQVKVGGGCIMDTQIYTRNREFRACGAVKLKAPDRVLVAYDLENDCELVSPDEMPFEQWQEYLASNVPEGLDDLQLLKAGDDMLTLAKSKTPPISVNSIEQEALTCYFNSQVTASFTPDELRNNNGRRQTIQRKRHTAEPEPKRLQQQEPEKATTFSDSFSSVSSDNSDRLRRLYDDMMSLSS